jgi:hypothetical protein
MNAASVDQFTVVHICRTARQGRFGCAAGVGSGPTGHVRRAGRGSAEVGGGQLREQVTVYEFGAGMAG